MLVVSHLVVTADEQSLVKAAPLMMVSADEYEGVSLEPPVNLQGWAM